MTGKMFKRVFSAALALAMVLALTGCGGEVSPTQTPESTPEQEANTLVLGVCRQSASALSFRGVVEDYNDTNPAKTVELVYFDHTNQMLDAIDEGTHVDMYLLDEPFTGVDGDRIKALMAALKELGAPVVLSSHEGLVRSLADQVINLDGPPLRRLPSP